MRYLVVGDGVKTPNLSFLCSTADKIGVGVSNLSSQQLDRKYGVFSPISDNNRLDVFDHATEISLPLESLRTIRGGKRKREKGKTERGNKKCKGKGRGKEYFDPPTNQSSSSSHNV